MISGGYRCPLSDDDAAVTTTDLGSDQTTHPLDSAPIATPSVYERDLFTGNGGHNRRGTLTLGRRVSVSDGTQVDLDD